jgi:mannosyl-oligosaccharide alpha-1,2-mannosidase
MAHAYLGYERWGDNQDELRPLSRSGGSGYDMGLTMIDSLDTLLIMGLTPQYERASTWVRDRLRMGIQEGISTFETTIRVLGGLLSAYSLRPQDTHLLNQAKALGESMLFGFDSPTGLPYATLHLRSRRKSNPSWSGGASTFAEATVQLEWQYLSRVTGDPRFHQAAERVNTAVEKLNVPLYTQYVNPDSGKLTDGTVTFGARVDSAYEYFLKQFVLAGPGGDGGARAQRLYLESMSAMEEQVVFDSKPSNLTFIAELQHGRAAGKMDHLVCFIPGMLGLGVFHGAPDSLETAQWHFDLAERLAQTCNEFYVRAPTGLAPEIEQFGVAVGPYTAPPAAAPAAATAGGAAAAEPKPLERRRASSQTYDYSKYDAKTLQNNLHLMKTRHANSGVESVFDFKIDPRAKHNLLRPETVESLFLMYRFTGDPKYRQWGWEIFLSFVRYCRIHGGGYSSLADVTVTAGAPVPEVETADPVTADYKNKSARAPERWPNYRDHMESFYLAETLKYLYLLFSPEDVMPLDQWVFNTEAHAFPIALPPDVYVKEPLPHIAPHILGE